MNPASRLLRSLLLLVSLILLLVGAAGCGSETPAGPALPPLESASPTPLRPADPETALTPPPSGTLQNLLLLSLTESGYAHLYIYSPQALPLTRLTADPWDDISPALSPDGKWVAYASRRNGYWDLYALSLETGQVNRLTDSPAYEGAPSWSPDGQWLVYETLVNDSLDIYVRSVSDPAQAPIPLSEGPALDTAPAWSPLGRQVAFVSNRSGDPEIWLADLDRVGEERFTNLSRSPNSVEAHPVWSPDGSRLAWGSLSLETGLSAIYVWDSAQPQAPARWIGAGDWPVWQDNDHLLARLPAANQTFLTAYALPAGTLTLPPVLLPGTLRGLAVLPSLAWPIPSALQQAAAASLPPLYLPAITPAPDVPAGRANLVRLQNVDAPYPQMHDMVDESFQALRARIAADSGWDALASLENAFVPLTVPLDPGRGEDWLYTGRAFSLNPVLLNAGWMVAVREDIGPQTYWRVYLRTRAQDGSQGQPLTQAPWDFSLRYRSDPSAYEAGGALMAAVPGGYWLDLTTLAAQYGWERLPALANWRTYFTGTRFNEFALTQGLDWRSAMLELYPPEALVTPTVVIPPTRTPTRTPRGYQTPTVTRTPTPRPTFTP